MYVCVLDEKGEIREHRNMNTNPESFLAAIAPFREDVVVAVECMFTWYWLADLCRKEGIPFVPLSQYWLTYGSMYQIYNLYFLIDLPKFS